MTQNNVTVRQLEAFLGVVETRSFVRAAERVGLSQPALSMSIRRLEEAIGARLFDRTTRSVEPTPEGREFEIVARGLVEDWSDAFSSIHDLISKRRGRVAVAALPSTAASVLPIAMARFSAAHPGIDLLVRDALESEILSLLKGGKVDFGFSVDPGGVDGLTFEPLLTDRFVALLREDHPLAGRSQVAWSDLAGFPLVTMSRTTSVRRRMEEALGPVRPRLRRLYEVDHLATVGGMVAAGLGASAIPSFCLPVALRERLIWRPLVKPRVERRLGLVRRAHHSLSVAASAFCSALREVIAEPSSLGPGSTEIMPEQAAQENEDAT